MVFPSSPREVVNFFCREVPSATEFPTKKKARGNSPRLTAQKQKSPVSFSEGLSHRCFMPLRSAGRLFSSFLHCSWPVFLLFVWWFVFFFFFKSGGCKKQSQVLAGPYRLGCEVFPHTWARLDQLRLVRLNGRSSLRIAKQKPKRGT